MKHKAHERHYVALAMFFFGGLVLCGTLIYFFYTHRQVDKAHTFVMLFKGSLKGLVVGSPVTYRGVRIGLIDKIELTENKRTGEIEIPVYVHFYIEQTLLMSKNPVYKLILNGWVATISEPALLTGQSGIELIHKKNKSRKPIAFYKTYAQFPTAPYKDKSKSLTNTLKVAEQTLKNISKLISSKQMKDTINAAQLMALSFERLATSVDRTLPDVVFNLNETLQQVSMAAYAHKTLTDYLALHPEALITGKSS